MSGLIGKKIGSYTVRKLLGKGTFGEVYLGLHERLSRTAAIKVLKHEYCEDTDTVARFNNEAKACNIINHPNVVQVLDFGQLPTPDNRLYMVMDAVNGDELKHHMQ